jgi:hypothetical protein
LMLANISVKENIVQQDQYKFLFSVEEVNYWAGQLQPCDNGTSYTWGQYRKSVLGRNFAAHDRRHLIVQFQAAPSGLWKSFKISSHFHGKNVPHSISETKFSSFSRLLNLLNSDGTEFYFINTPSWLDRVMTCVTIKF